MGAKRALQVHHVDASCGLDPRRDASNLGAKKNEPTLVLSAHASGPRHVAVRISLGSAAEPRPAKCPPVFFTAGCRNTRKLFVASLERDGIRAFRVSFSSIHATARSARAMPSRLQLANTELNETPSSSAVSSSVQSSARSAGVRRSSAASSSIPRREIDRGQDPPRRPERARVHEARAVEQLAALGVAVVHCPGLRDGILAPGFTHIFRNEAGDGLEDAAPDVPLYTPTGR